MKSRMSDSGIRPVLRRALGGAAALALSLSVFGGLGVLGATSAQAIVSDLPTWDDVQRAKNDEAAAAVQVTEIESLIVQVQAEVAETQRALDQAVDKQRQAEDALDLAQMRLATLEEQAAASQAEAEEASNQAAALVSQLYRSGGVDRNLDLFLESDDTTADVLLDRLARMEKATERNSTISDKAEQALNSAKSLGDQAESARNERDRLNEEAVTATEAAAVLADAARTKLAERESQLVDLEAQLAALKDTTTTTVAGYEERVQLEREEQARLEEERRKAAEEAAAGGGGGGGSGGGGGVVSSGWSYPLSGGWWVSTEWWGYYGHRGIDLAIGSWTPIYAANSGTVTYSGYNGGYGNVVYIDHGDGYSTRYAHQVQTAVWRGDWVNSGDLIGYVGSTGDSTGPHLHFEVLDWGTKINPRPFMADRGVYF